jgi:hypothetical protein
MAPVRKRELAKFPNRKYGIALSVTGAQKNEIVRYAEEIGVSVNQLITYAALMFIRNEKNIPEPGPSQYSKVTADDVIRSYITGERLLQPCGQKECVQDITEISGMEFCKTCNLRTG